MKSCCPVLSLAHECSVKLSGLTRYWSWDQLWASPRWLYGDCTSEIVNPHCANMSVKRLQSELAKLGEKTHQRRSKRIQLFLHPSGTTDTESRLKPHSSTRSRRCLHRRLLLQRST